MEKTTLGKLFLKEMEMEEKATRRCIEKFDATLKEYKPHDRSMKMGSLVQVVSEMPLWIAHSLEVGDIDFVTWPRFKWDTTEDLLKFYDENISRAKKALENAKDEDMEKIFSLKNNDQVLMSLPNWDNISSMINHWVHHRGQLTVYMRLNNIPVPSIYGPSADEPNF